MHLTEFLLARIAEDAADAQAAIDPDQMYPWGDTALHRRTPEQMPFDVEGYLGGSWGKHFARWASLRVLAECAAKRKIVEMDLPWDPYDGAAEMHDDIVRLLALPYADHPDYQPEWRPGNAETPAR